MPDGSAPIRHSRRGVVAIARRSLDGRFLVIRRGLTLVAGGKVCFPGGHIEPGEEEDEAIVRECHEELAARVEARWRECVAEAQHAPVYVGRRLFTRGLAGDSSFLPTTLLPLVREGRLRAIAWTGETRSPAAPEVPTVAEAAGLAGFRAVNWFGLFARAGTPEPVLDALHAQAVAALAVPEVAERFARDAVEVAPLPRADFTRFVADEMAVWAEVIRARGITPG